MDYEGQTLLALGERKRESRESWAAKKPFRYLVLEDFLPTRFAEEILAAYPRAGMGEWDSTTYVHQRNKLTQTHGFAEPIARFFRLTAAPEFRRLVSGITGIRDLIADPELVGGGLHQVLRGGFLDVHVDYNRHPRTKLHRRLNLLLYLNKEWREEYEGYLELWDLDADVQLEKVAPLFNRAVIFETNEVSYHGHPKPLNVPAGVTRKSLALYYYTKEREGATVAPEHNTLYKQTTGLKGYVKTVKSATEAAAERLGGQGVSHLSKDLARRLSRRLRGLPPENK
ncbi:MAG TPA: 2OG-Fe(II) oxygenase [Pyrinomonadaceae bacterium]|nr:2OG-Fe(II) oxygenase [Pyrinomonadaceae bacterium]